jgi:hypothetical protein
VVGKVFGHNCSEGSCTAFHANTMARGAIELLANDQYTWQGFTV